MNTTIDMIGYDKALSKMEDTIRSLTPIGNSDKEYCCISIYVKDNESLYYASKLLENLDVKARSVLMMPAKYAICNFDCFTIANLFSSVHSEENDNVDTVCLHEDTFISDGDFYVSAIRRNKESGLMNIYTFRTFHSYCIDED